jgi:hypothetical protein
MESRKTMDLVRAKIEALEQGTKVGYTPLTDSAIKSPIDDELKKIYNFNGMSEQEKQDFTKNGMEKLSKIDFSKINKTQLTQAMNTAAKQLNLSKDDIQKAYETINQFKTSGNKK